MAVIINIKVMVVMAEQFDSQLKSVLDSHALQDQDQDQYIARAYSGYRRNGKRESAAPIYNIYKYNLQFFIFLLFLLVLFVKTYLDWFFVFRN